MTAGSLQAAYLETDYVVQSRSGEVVLRIGKRSATADRLLHTRRRRDGTLGLDRFLRQFVLVRQKVE